jgi:NTP pyrophosphatase (non-canonical NTP hydrolase)
MMSDEVKKPDLKLMEALFERIKSAEEKHPDFSDGIYQGVGVIGEEYGELCQALNKGEGEERVMDEALDLLCVAWRFCRGDWRQGND